MVFDLKLDNNSGLHAKNRREISSHKVRRFHRPFGGDAVAQGEMHFKVQNRVSRPNIDYWWLSKWTKHKVFEKCGKTLVFDSKQDRNSGMHALIESEGFRDLLEGGGRVAGKGEMHYRVQNWVSRPNVDDFWHPTWT